MRRQGQPGTAWKAARTGGNEGISVEVRERRDRDGDKDGAEMEMEMEMEAWGCGVCVDVGDRQRVVEPWGSGAAWILPQRGYARPGTT